MHTDKSCLMCIAMRATNRFIRLNKVFLLLHLLKATFYDVLLHRDNTVIFFVFSLPMDLTMQLIAPGEEKVIKQVLQPGSGKIEVRVSA